MKVFGLTGGISCGKSTVAARINNFGIPVIDADVLAREAVKPESLAFKEIVNFFGIDILLPSGELDRAKLGSLVFSDKTIREKLNSIVHPKVNELLSIQILNFSNKGFQLACYDSALLIETNSHELFKPVIVVHADENVQIERLCKRNNLSRDEAIKRINSQLSTKEKLRYADYHIDNSSSIEDLYKVVDSIINDIFIRANL